MAGALATLEARRRLPLDRGTLLLVAAHTLVLAAFFLPWVEGSFGERSTLSGLEIAQLSPERSSNGLLAVVGPYAWALYLLPALALDGLLLASLGERLGLARLAHPLSYALALPGAAASVVVLAYLATEGALLAVIAQAPLGLVLLLLASACLAVALFEGVSRRGGRA